MPSASRVLLRKESAPRFGRSLTWVANSALICTMSYSMDLGCTGWSADQHLIQDLRVPLKDVAVLLLRRQHLHQIGEPIPLQCLYGWERIGSQCPDYLRQ